MSFAAWPELVPGDPAASGELRSLGLMPRNAAGTFQAPPQLDGMPWSVLLAAEQSSRLVRNCMYQPGKHRL